MEAPPKGPFVKAALFCEKVIEEKDGVMTFVRIIDKLMQTAMGPAVPETLPPINHAMTCIVMLNPGDAVGRHDFLVAVEPPSGFGRPGENHDHQDRDADDFRSRGRLLV